MTSSRWAVFSNSYSFSGTDEIGHRLNLHFVHDTRAVDFDILLARAQVRCYLLIEFPHDNVLHDFALARCERGETGCQCYVSGGQLQSSVDGPDQCTLINWFGEEVRRASLDGLHAHGNIAMTGEENDRDKHSFAVKPFLKFQSIKLRHRHIQHQARDFRRTPCLQECAYGSKTAYFEPLGS